MTDTVTPLTGAVAIVGSMNADLTVRTATIPKPGETVAGQPLQILPGGKSANQAVCAAKLGADVAMVGAIGSDANAQVLRDSLTTAGVDTTHVATVDTPTGTAVITVDDAGENCIVVSAGANGQVTPAMVDAAADAITNAQVVGLCLEIPVDAVVHTARIAHAAGTTVVFNLSPILPIDRDFLTLVDILIVNEHELVHVLTDYGGQGGARLAGQLSDGDITDDLWHKVGQALLGLGVGSAIVTLGGAGSVVLTDDRVVPIDAHPVDVVDTTGCGDSFMATIVAAVASGMDIVDGAQMASVVSAYAARGVGAQMSYGTVAEIRDYFHA